MLQQLGFLPQRQFHVLVNLPGQQLNLTIMPHYNKHFKVIEHGHLLGEIDLTSEYKCVRRSGNLNRNIVKQLEQHIADYYNRFKGLFS